MIFEKDLKRLWMVIFPFVIILSLHIKPIWSTCNHPGSLKNGRIEVPRSTATGSNSGVFLNGSRAQFICDDGFYLNPPHITSQLCINGKWINDDGNIDSSDHNLLPVCVQQGHGKKCNRPPAITHGGYDHVFKSRSEQHDSVISFSTPEYPAGTQLLASCEHMFMLDCSTSHYSTSSSNKCGHILCSDQGDWILPTNQWDDFPSCIYKTDTMYSGSNGARRRTRSTLQNYLLLVLAIICLVIVGAITIFLMRRPFFCKKRSDSTSRNSPMYIAPMAADLTDPLDSIPVAMNTGIFVPGADYDLQNLSFQEGTIVGTTVFK